MKKETFLKIRELLLQCSSVLGLYDEVTIHQVTQIGFHNYLVVFDCIPAAHYTTGQVVRRFAEVDVEENRIPGCYIANARDVQFVPISFTPCF